MPAFLDLQELKLETDSLDAFAAYLRLSLQLMWEGAAPPIHVAIENGIPGKLVGMYPSQTAANLMNSVSESELGDEDPFRFYWLIGRIGDERPYEFNSETWSGPNHEAIVEKVLQLLHKADLGRFIEKTGRGPFAGEDGLVDVGYRLSCASGRNLTIALCHVYYSK